MYIQMIPKLHLWVMGGARTPKYSYKYSTRY